MNTRLLASLITGSVILTGPASALAATAVTSTSAKEISITDVTEEDLMNAIDAAPATPAMLDGRGGLSMPYYPSYGGVMVDATVTKEITPDFVALNAYCDLGKQATRESAKAAAEKIFNDIKSAVGTDGRVRKTGAVSVYPYYGPMGETTESFSANLSIFIRVVKTTAAERISDAVEKAGCAANWDVRLLDPQTFELSVLDDLSARLNKRKAIFEKLLGKKLTTIVSASLNTWVDGYSTYDPATNKAEATTTLSVSFSMSGRSTLPTRRTMDK